jgi:hypothetical protein
MCLCLFIFTITMKPFNPKTLFAYNRFYLYKGKNNRIIKLQKNDKILFIEQNSNHSLLNQS